LAQGEGAGYEGKGEGRNFPIFGKRKEHGEKGCTRTIQGRTRRKKELDTPENRERAGVSVRKKRHCVKKKKNQTKHVS